MSAKKFEIIWFASNGKTYSISWIHKQRHPDPTVSGLADKLYKHTSAVGSVESSRLWTL